uniref:Uncharacterized protein n=1 Tax=Arundo donax TaxID=35708 RepID=A0A0A8YYZ3_ARUDO
MSVVEPNAQMVHQQVLLQNALIATPMPSSLAKPIIKDIYIAIQNQCGPQAKPSNITSFPPDFILQFSTPIQRDVVQSYGTLKGPYFTLSVQP